MMEILQTRDLDACFAVRRAVFVQEQGIAEEEDIDGLDPVATQFVARDGDTTVGTLRILEKGAIGKIGRLAVLKSHRGKGLGAALMKAAIAHLETREGISEARLGAQLDAIAFYTALGFHAEGPEFLDAGLPHQEMVRPL